MANSSKGAYGADSELVDYILGITFEIWEQRGVDLIDQYYSPDIAVYALDGITRGSAGMIAGTHAMLEAFPDRLLIADDVIWSGTREEGFYSSHRIVSPMTNKGATAYGPATNKRVQILTIADTFVEEGVITREWLIRDNHALVTQLGFDTQQCARLVAERRNDESNRWMASEIDRLRDAGVPDALPDLPAAKNNPQEFAGQVLANCWTRGDAGRHAEAYAPYVVQRRSPIEWYSGHADVAEHFAELRRGISVDGLSVDHIAVQPADSNGIHMAVRWTAAGTHSGEFLGLGASGKPVFILASTHWRIESGRIALEWTVFDGLGVLSQLV